LELDKLIKTISLYYQVDAKTLTVSMKGKPNKPRAIAIYLTCQISGQSLQTIANVFSNITYSGISRVASKIKKQIKKNRTLQIEIEQIKNLCLHSQN